MNKPITKMLLMMAFIIHQHFGISQAYGFNETYQFYHRSTNFQYVLNHHDTLVLIGQLGQDSSGIMEFFILKLDTLGDIHSISTFRDPTLSDDVLVTGTSPALLKGNGHIVIAGSMLDRNNLFLTEIDQNGTIIFFKEYESHFRARFTNTLLEFDGYYYMTGHIQTQAYDTDVFVHKTDGAGNSKWEKTYGEADYREASRAAIQNESGILVLSVEGYDPDPTIPNDTKRWTRFSQIDTSGSISWTWLSSLNEEGISSGGLLKIGTDFIYTLWPTWQYDNNSQDLGSQIVRRNSDFDVVWREDYSSILAFNGIHALAVGNDSMIGAAGQVYDDVMWAHIWKLNPENGDIIWTAQDTGIYQLSYGSKNTLEALTILESGSIIAVGETYDPQTGFTHGLLLKVTTDGCIDTLCTTVGLLPFTEANQTEILVYPNPANDILFIDFPDQEETHLFFYTLNGNIIEFKTLTSGINSIKLPPDRFPSGMYYWKAVNRKHELLQAGWIIIQ